MKRGYYIALLVLLLSYFGKTPVYADGQDQHIIDSLNSVIESAKHDTSVAAAYVALSDILYISNPDTLIPLCTKAVEIADKNMADGPSALLEKKYLAIKAAAINNIGYIYQLQGDVDKGLAYFEQGLKIREDIEDELGQAESLNNIGYIYHSHGDASKALEYYHKSLKIKEKLGDYKNISTSLNNIGYIYQSRGEIAKGLEYYLRSLEIDRTAGDKKGIATDLNNIGSIYDDQGDMQKGLEYFLESLKIYEELGDNVGEATTLNNIAQVYRIQGHHDDARVYYNKGLQKYEEIGDKKGMAYCLNNIASIYRYEGDIVKGLELYNKSLKLYEEVDHKKGIAYTLTNIGGLYKNHGDPFCTLPEGECQKLANDKGLEFYHKSLKIQEFIGDKYGIAISYISIGWLHFSQGNDILATEFATKSMELARKINYPRNIRDAAELLSDIDKFQGNYEESLKMYELYIQMRDSIKNEETKKSAIRQQTKYEFEKDLLLKEQEEKELARIEAVKTARRDNLQYSVILISILLLFGLVLSLGFIRMSPKIAEGIIFFSFLILFEFLLVLADPYIENWSGGAPGIKLLFNAGIAALIFPAHAFFETKIKRRLAK